MPLAIGARLGSYEILSALGAGGMGEVYRARDTKLKRDVALKILPDHFAQDRDRLARFQREAEALAALNHPNIAAIYGLEQAPSTSSGQGATHALVLELVDGETLAGLIAKEGTPKAGLELDDALSIALQIATAVEAAHAKGIIHRDLKPANIKVTPDGRVKVLDFGLAKMFATTPDATDVSNSPTIVGTVSGSAGVILGTAAYMSPEQARGKPVDARTDIWAFGCVLYEMFTGKAAFTGETITDILGAIVKSEPDWAALPAETPAAIRRLLKRCLVKDPHERLHAIADARLEIAEAGKEPSSSSPTVAMRSTHERLVWVIGAVALIALLALAIPATLYFTSRSLPAGLPQMRLEVNTRATADPISFALSPDGQRLVFAGSEDGTTRLWIRSLDTMASRPLIGTESSGQPFWSPDSRSIGFFTANKLKRIDVDGGAPLELADVNAGRGGTWNSGGVIVFGRSQGVGLFRVSATGGEVTAVTQIAPRQVSHRFPQFLPDGHRFLYFAQGPADIQGVYLGSIDSVATTRVIASDVAAIFHPSGYLMFVRQGALVAQRFDLETSAATGNPVNVADVVGSDGAFGIGAFSVSSTGVIAHRAGGAGRRQFTWFDRTGHALGTVGEPDEYGQNYVDLSPDGKRVVFDRTVGSNRDIWIGDVARGVLTRFTSDTAVDAAPTWSCDGSLIYFRSMRTRSSDLFQKSSTSDSTESTLLETTEPKVPSDCSSDGRFLLYVATDAKTLNDLWVMPLTGDRKPFPYVQSPFDERQGQFSPDVHWVAYQSDETGQLEIYMRPFPGPGRPEKISTSGGGSPRWRADGRELYYMTVDGKVMAVPISTQGSTIVPGTPSTLFQPPVAAGPWSTVSGNLRQQYDVSADGRFLFNLITQEAVSPITLILNWKPK